METVKVTEIGDVSLSPTLTLNKVLFVPSFKFNLISVKVYCLALQLHGALSFNSVSYLLQVPSLKSPLEHGRAENGPYFVCHNCCPSFGEINSSHVK